MDHYAVALLDPEGNEFDINEDIGPRVRHLILGNPPIQSRRTTTV